MSRALGLTLEEADVLAAEYGRLRADRATRMRNALGRSRSIMVPLFTRQKGYSLTKTLYSIE